MPLSNITIVHPLSFKKPAAAPCFQAGVGRAAGRAPPANGPFVGLGIAAAGGAAATSSSKSTKLAGSSAAVGICKTARQLGHFTRARPFCPAH